MIPTISVADQVRVLQLGWSSDKLLDELIAIDYESLDSLTSSSEGNRDQWRPVFWDSPDTWRVLLDEQGSVAGYWHFVSLASEAYALALSGKLMDVDITPMLTVPMSTPGIYDVYMVSMCIRPRWQSQGLSALLLDSFAEALSRLADRQVFIGRLCTNVYSVLARAFVQKLGLQYRCAHSSAGEIYDGNLGALLSRAPNLAGWEWLRRVYGERKS